VRINVTDREPGGRTGRKEDTESEQVKSWADALENYTFRDLVGRTELLVEMDTAEEYREMLAQGAAEAQNEKFGVFV
jgi:hypothetical protein